MPLSIKTGAVKVKDSDGDYVDIDLTLSDGYAPLESPAFTGTPTAPTPGVSDDSTKVATTAFVQDVVDSLDAGDIEYSSGATYSNGSTGKAISDLNGSVSNLSGAINNEATARRNADTAIQNSLLADLTNIASYTVTGVTNTTNLYITKIGNFVHLNGYLNLEQTTPGLNEILVQNLPERYRPTQNPSFYAWATYNNVTGWYFMSLRSDGTIRTNVGGATLTGRIYFPGVVIPLV